VVLCPQFVGGWDTPDFGHAFSSHSHFQACGQFWLSSIQLARTVAGEKERRRRKKKESVVKYKFADMTTMSGGIMTGHKVTKGMKCH